MKKLSVGPAAEYVGVTPKTLREYEKQGLIKPERTPGGQRRYSITELEKLKTYYFRKERNR